jgi:alkanesulfonate monooxygenase SsuD/methylene tetrahydromethanopterin reductase-like flavin-dependent oxidoreductase (luciferase family)
MPNRIAEPDWLKGKIAELRERARRHVPVSYFGATPSDEFVSFERIWCDPKPLQKPHPPILVGGEGPTVLDRVLEYGDAWMPNGRPGVLPRIAELRERAGRHVEVIVTRPEPDPARLEQYEQAGVDRVLFWVASARRSVVESELDRIERAMFELHDRPA